MSPAALGSARTLSNTVSRGLREARQRFDAFSWRVLTWAGGSDVSPSRLIWQLGTILSCIMLGGVGIAVLVPGITIGWLFGEGDLMTWISSLLLLFCSCICFRIWTLRAPISPGDIRSPEETEKIRSTRVALWKYLAYGFAFLAADELLRVHETFDRQLHKLLGFRPTDMSDHLDDFIVALYGITIITVMVWGAAEIVRYLSVRLFSFGALFFGALTVALDFLASAKWLWRSIFTNPAQIQLAIDVFDVLEEMCKIYAELCFVGAFLACWHIARTLQPPNVKSREILPTPFT